MDDVMANPAMGGSLYCDATVLYNDPEVSPAALLALQTSKVTANLFLNRSASLSHQASVSLTTLSLVRWQTLCQQESARIQVLPQQLENSPFLQGATTRSMWEQKFALVFNSLT